ncbi:uncharacterized protein [Eleutherodactylus coqui]
MTIAPCELDYLTKVEEIIFKEKVFQTRDGQTLFSVHQEKAHLEPTLNLYFRDRDKKDVVGLHLISDDGSGSYDTFLQIIALPMHPIGNVKIDSVSGNLNICIQMTKNTCTFIASLPMFLQTQRSTSIEILSMNGSHQVAKIIGERDGTSAQVLFQFSMGMESCAKTVILGAFLYLNFHLHESRRLDNFSTTFQDLWIIDCVSWENGSAGGKEKGRNVDFSSNGADCLTECRNCLCWVGDCFICIAECCNCCFCSLICLQCVLYH